VTGPTTIFGFLKDEELFSSADSACQHGPAPWS
jgi:hypothetical protein